MKQLFIIILVLYLVLYLRNFCMKVDPFINLGQESLDILNIEKTKVNLNRENAQKGWMN